MVVVARVEPERVSEDLVANGGVAVGAVADREDMPGAAEQRLERAEREQQRSPQRELAVVAMDDPAVDRLFDHQRGGDRGPLPAEPGQDRADDADTLAANRSAEEAPR